MKFCPGGDMQGLLSQHGTLPVQIAQHYSAELLLAIAHLHDHKIIHRDLKPENVVFDEERHAMLTDFGLSKECVNARDANKSFLGSVAFIAPEILERHGHNCSVDVYGLGVLLFTMLVGTSPFYDKGREKMWQDIKSAPLIVPDSVPQVASDFIKQTMCRDPASRLGSARTLDAQRHLFFASMNFAALSRREVPVPPLQRDIENSTGKAREGLSSNGLTQCPASHELISFLLEGDASAACDNCGAAQRAGNTMRSCRECDYDICGVCSGADDPSKLEKRSRAQRRAIFGYGKPRFLQCFSRGRVEDWDYVSGESIIDVSSPAAWSVASTSASNCPSRQSSDSSDLN